MRLVRMVRPLAPLAVAFALFALASSKPIAQSGGVTITFAKYSSTNWPAGPDFATDVLGDPWDFSNNADVFPDPGELVGWQTLFLNGTSFPRDGQSGGQAGMVGGTTVNVNGQDSMLNLHFRGRYGILNPDRTGRDFPIDANAYQKLSYRLTSTRTGDGGRILWFPFPWNDPSLPENDPNDGGGCFAPTVSDAARMYWVNLENQNGQGDCDAGGGFQANNFGRDWNSTGTIRGLRISPNLTTWGHSVFYDWVRLTVPDGPSSAAHMQNISWTGGSGPATIEVLDSNGTPMTVATNVESPYLWNYGVLPPGNYTMRITRTGTTPGTRAFTVQAPPVVTMLKPNKEGDEDFATTVLGNAWDMNTANDVLVTGHENYTPVPAIFDGMMHAQNTGHPIAGGSDPLGDDPQIWLLDYTNNTNGRTIDTSRYRYFTVRYNIDDPDDTREWGVGRIFWTDAQFLDANTATNTKDIDIWPGFHSYTIDLAPLHGGPDGGLEPGIPGNPPKAWTSADMTSFRYDPSEFWSQRWFHVDHVYLRAMAETADGGYTFRWEFTGSSNAAVNLYLDTDRNAGNGKGTQIASNVDIDDGADSNGYFWAQGNTAPGDYWVYVEATDNLQTRGYYGSGQLKVLNNGPQSNPAMSVDTPQEGATVNTNFTVAGWAVDLGATSGPGVDAIHIWAQPQGSSSLQFVAVADYGQPRDDLAGILGPQFRLSGYTASASLAPGNYLLLVYSHSTVTGEFSQVIGHNITVSAPVSQPATAIDTPQPLSGSLRPADQDLLIKGWALDMGAPTGTGVGTVHVWAFQNGQQPGTFIGVDYGRPRPDVGSAFGDARFNNSGYEVTVPANTFAPGTTWFFVVFGWSTVTQNFTQTAGTWVTFE